MKNNKGFTLIELIAVIILVGLIALIITPKITKVLKTQKMNIFKDSVEGIVKAVKEDAVNNTSFNSTTTSNYRAYIYDGTGLYLTVAGNKAVDADIKISGNIDNAQGTVVVTNDSNVVLAVYNDKFCAKKNADDTSITVEDYSGTCVNAEIDIPEATSCFTYKNNPDNTITITGYDYNNAACSKDLVIPNRINGKIVSKLSDFAFLDAEVKIVLYSEKDGYGNTHFYQEYASNVPTDKEKLYLVTVNTADITGKRCFTDTEENNSVAVDANYIHTSGDGYYGCSFGMPHTPDSGIINNYKFTSIDFSHATAVTKIPFGLIPFSSVGSVNIGDYITEIGAMAFAKNYIQNINIPKNVIDINYFAFQFNQIDNVDFINAKNLKSIKSGAFSENSIASVTFSNNITSIGEGAFYQNALTSLIIPNTITSIGPSAFSYNAITSVTIPTSVTSIGDSAFQYNNILQGSATIDNVSANVTLGANVFDNNGADKNTIITPVFLR